MHRKLIILTLWLAGSMTVMAQRENQGVFDGPVMPGPNGVLIYTADTTGHMRRPAPGQSYTLYKDQKKIASFGFPASSDELQKRLPPTLLQDILRNRRLRSVQDLYTQLAKGRLDTLGVYSNTTAVQEALGALYIDTKQKFDPGVSYRLDVGTHTLYQITLGNIRYTALPTFKKYRTMVTDSFAMVIWYVPNIHVPYKKETPRAAFATIFTTAGSGTTTIFTANTRQYVYNKRDTLFLTYTTPLIPGSKTALFIRPEDLAGNRGPSSDTVHLLAVNLRNTITINHFTATDTMGSILLKWDSLPQKAYCSGIQVMKSRDAVKDYIVIDTLPVTATSYRDRKTISGNVYFYQLRPILVDLPQHGHITPATAHVNTKKHFSKIPAPQGLQISLTQKSDIRLSWLPNSDLDIFAYYILRGTSKANMQVISPAIRDTVFVDTLKGLNPGITYLYSVAALNMDMLWSDTSAPVGIQSPRARLVTAPGGIQGRVSNGGVRLNWNDVRQTDPSVMGYVVYRRKKGEPYFTTVNTTLLTGDHFTDSSNLPAGVYEYACSSMDAWNHLSILTPTTEVSIKGDALYAPASFSLRNLPAGIELKVPSMVGASGKYVLYRRSVLEKNYRKLTEISSNTTCWIDKTVVKDQLYAYAIAWKSADIESVKSSEISIRRK